MISETSLPRYFLEDVVNIACHILNRVDIRYILEKTPFNYLKIESQIFHSYDLLNTILYVCVGILHIENLLEEVFSK